jgi:hypothetical protein
MLDTLKKIGEVVKNDSIGRVKYHPLIRKLIVNNKKKSYICYNIDINTKNNSIKINKNPIPLDEILVLKYDVGGNTFPYLIGAIENTNHVKFNTYMKSRENMDSLGIKDTLMLQVADIINDNISAIQAFEASVTISTPLSVVIINFTIDGIEFHAYTNILDAVDEAFINNISNPSKDNPKYVLLQNTLLGIFKTSGKLSQSANLSFVESYKSLPITKVDLNNLLYSVKFHESIIGGNIVGDYYLTFLPRFTKMNYQTLDDFMNIRMEKYDATTMSVEKAKYAQRNNEPLFNKPLTIAEKVALKKAGKLNKPELNFDLIFKLKGGNSTQDISLISNLNISKIEQINQRIIDAQKAVSGIFPYTTSLAYSFYSFLKKPEKSDAKEYNTFIIKNIINIINDNYYGNTMLDDIFIERMEYHIRNLEESEITKQYTHLITKYKFLRFMETKGKQNYSSIINSGSYKLGYELGMFSSTYQKDRKNLVKFINIFNGYISKRIINMEDVMTHYNEVQSRLVINGCENYPNKFLKAFHSLSTDVQNGTEDFDMQRFIFGYFDAQYSYKGKSNGGVATESESETESKEEILEKA